MNTTHQIGRLTADPEPIRDTEHGKVTTFRLAVPRAKASAREADFLTVEVWDRTAELCAAHLTQGREVAVVGRLEQREWRTESDERRERIVIVGRQVDFLRSPRRETAAATPDAADDAGEI